MKNYTKTKTDRIWFSRLLWHPTRKQSGSILTTLEPEWGLQPMKQWVNKHTSGQPKECSTRPGRCNAGSTSHSSLRPIPYDWGSQFSRSLNRLNSCFARLPWQPSANTVHRACNSIPRANESCKQHYNKL